MRHRSEADYIDRTIETVRQHRNADNCWPSWANIFADEIEDLRADLDSLERTLRDAWKANVGELAEEYGAIVASRDEQLEEADKEATRWRRLLMKEHDHVERLQAQLKEYGQHKAGCSRLSGSFTDVPPCDCGWDGIAAGEGS